MSRICFKVMHCVVAGGSGWGWAMAWSCVNNVSILVTLDTLEFTMLVSLLHVSLKFHNEKVKEKVKEENGKKRGREGGDP